jgi:hypothetical protein
MESGEQADDSDNSQMIRFFSYHGLFTCLSVHPGNANVEVQCHPMLHDVDKITVSLATSIL